MHEIAFKRGRRRAVCRPASQLLRPFPSSDFPPNIQPGPVACDDLFAHNETHQQLQPRKKWERTGGVRKGFGHKVQANLFGSRLGINSKSTTTSTTNGHSAGKCSKSISQFHFPRLTADHCPSVHFSNRLPSAQLGFCAIYLI